MDPRDTARFAGELANFHMVSLRSLASFLNSRYAHSMRKRVICNHTMVLFYSLDKGLSDAAAEELLKKNGPNALPKVKDLPLCAKFLLSFTSGFAPLLWFSAFFVFLSWKPFGTPPTDVYNLALAVVLLIVIFVSGLFQFFNEVRTSKLLAIFANMLPPDCTVIRGGKHREILPSNLVVGDLVVLTTGCQVPADLRMISVDSLKIDKSMLTGETNPVKLTTTTPKQNSDTVMLESHNMAFMGCTVVEGQGTGIVLFTGSDTQLAKIVDRVGENAQRQTSLQREINRFVVFIGIIASVCASVCIAVWGLYLDVKHPGFMTAGSMVANAIGVLVAFVPEGLPLALSVGLTIIARRLCVDHFVLVKQLSIIETLGSMNMLACDKTGTLTSNMMIVTDVISLKGISSDDDLTRNSKLISTHVLLALNRISVLCNQCALAMDYAEVRISGGNGTDRAVMKWAFDIQEDRIVEDQPHETFSTKLIVPFNSTDKVAWAVVQPKAKRTTLRCWVLLKGAPEYVMDRCSTVMALDGSAVPLTADIRADIQRYIDLLSIDAKRVICLAEMILPEQFDDFQFECDPSINFPSTGLTLVGAVAISDPARDGALNSIRELRAAGISVSMITGDAITTATAIARKVGIIADGNITIDEMDTLKRFYDFRKEDDTVGAPAEVRSECIIVDGTTLNRITADGWDFVFAHKEMVLARVTPDQKLMFVKACQSRGYRVGVTGDGVNDSPALKRADVGIAMNSGTDVARDAAGIILLRDDFNCIPEGVCEGRLIFSNLRKIIAYQISAGCWSEAIPVFATFFFGMPQPLSTFLMIIISCVTDVFAGIALSQELPESDIMTVPPRDVRRSRLVDVPLIAYAYFFYANMLSIVCFFNYFYYMYHRGPVHQVATPLPEDDDGNVDFPIGYTPRQLIGAWNFGLNENDLGEDMFAAANTASAVYFTTIVIGQMGHLLSVRRKIPYYFDSIMNTEQMGDARGLPLCSRLFHEMTSRGLSYSVIGAWCGSFITIVFFTEIPAIQVLCGTGRVPPVNWGIAFAGSVIVFIIAEIRKWIITLYPDSVASKILVKF